MYGDSVAAHTPVATRCAATGRLAVATFAEWAEAVAWSAMGHKEYARVPGMEAWTCRGWKPVRALVRHRVGAHKRMFRVRTAEGVVDVTEDHSLLRPDGSPLATHLAGVGDALLHSCPRGWATEEHGEPRRSGRAEAVRDALAELCGVLVARGMRSARAYEGEVEYGLALTDAEGDEEEEGEAEADVGRQAQVEWQSRRDVEYVRELLRVVEPYGEWDVEVLLHGVVAVLRGVPEAVRAACLEPVLQRERRARRVLAGRRAAASASSVPC